MNGKIAFIQEFRAAASQLRTFEIAGLWMRLAEEIPILTAQEAAAWADLGYRPEEAAPHIRAGVTAAQARELETLEEQLAGGKDALAGERIAAIIAGGAVTPADVIADPLNPGNEIVVLPPGWEAPKCGAVKLRPTATGDVEVRCTKPAGHVGAGDPKHYGMTGMFPLTWTD